MQSWPGSLTRMRSVFGAQPSSLLEASLQKLIDDQAHEAADLDFKANAYPKIPDAKATEKTKNGLAGDVAAMANDRGGVLVLGVKEDGEATATALTPVAIGDRELGRLRAVIAARTAPAVATEIVQVPSMQDPAKGWLLILVPASPSRPHAVTAPNRAELRYPRRNGTSTRWLTEAEVADLYRNRFTQARRDTDRVRAVRQEGMTGGIALKRQAEGALLAVALAPVVPGLMTIDRSRVDELNRWLVGGPPDGLGFAHWLGGFSSSPQLRTGHRRVVGGDSYADPLELHSDGSGFAAETLADIRQNPIAHGQQVDHDDILIVPAWLPRKLAPMLRRLGAHAVRNAGAYGDANLLVTLSSKKPVKLGYRPHPFSWEYANEALGHTALTCDATIPLQSLAGEDRDLLATTWLVATDLLQAWGSPEAGVYTRDGEVRLSDFTPEDDDVRALAQQRDVGLA